MHKVDPKKPAYSRLPKASGWDWADLTEDPTPHQIQACCWSGELGLTSQLGCITRACHSESSASTLLKGSQGIRGKHQRSLSQGLSVYMSAFLKEDRTSSCELIRPQDRQQLPHGPLRSREATVLQQSNATGRGLAGAKVLGQKGLGSQGK